MCGICGFAGFENKQLLKKMTQVMIHRGPDDVGFYFDNNLSLAQRRLSIIDLSGGHQPIYNEDKTICVVYNGEIYNFKQIRKDLEGRGHKFYTHSDTEVLVHLYEEEGIECVNELNGMFAFALWDKKAQKLVLARDRFGIKPLYYSIINGNLIFASEIKSILQYPGFAKEIDYSALDHYISFRYTIGEATIFKNVRKLSPATLLIFDRNKNIKLKKYWQLKIDSNNALSAKDCIQRFKDLLKDSVKLRLVSDVPFGAFLSGGVDSSAIVALMSKELKNPVNTFSVGFENDKDEVSYARYMSGYLKTNHHEEMVRSKEFKLLPKIIWHLDEPLGDAIIIPMYHLSQMAKKKVKMVLTGEGGDELLGGYIHQQAMFFADIYDRAIPDIIKSKLFARLIKHTPLYILDKFFNYPASLGQRGKLRLIDFLKSIKNKTQSYLTLVSLFDQGDKEALYSQNLKEKLSVSEDDLIDRLNEHFSSNKVANFYDKLLINEFNGWLPDNILFKQDKLTMANSIEARVPFLDHRLAEFAVSLPLRLKTKGPKGKFVLRQAMKNELPKNILGRKKQAFSVPVEKRFKDVLISMIDEFLSESAVSKRGIFNYDYIKTIKGAFEKSPFIYSKQLVSLLILEIWFRIYIDEEKFF